MKLPEDFVRFLQSEAPRCGDLADFPLYFEIWPDNEFEQWNREYQVEAYAPGFFGFATDGRGERYAFGPNPTSATRGQKPLFSRLFEALFASVPE